jgi:hypothetical protein
MNGQLHAPTALSHRKESRYQLCRYRGGPAASLHVATKRKILPYKESNCDRPARIHSHCGTLAPSCNCARPNLG